MAAAPTTNECQFDSTAHELECASPLRIITGDSATIKTEANNESQHLLTNAHAHHFPHAHGSGKEMGNDCNNNEVAGSDRMASGANSPRKLTKYTNVKFNSRSSLPLSSSPAPLRKSGSSLFDFDNSLKNPRSIKK